MSASVSCLPVWKKDSTPAEWLQEVAAIAMATPERFSRILVLYEEFDREGDPVKTRQQSYNIQANSQILGILEYAKLETFEYMKGRQ